MYFNIFYPGISKNNTLTSASHNCQYSIIYEVNTRDSGNQRRECGRGHRRGRRKGRVGGRGRGVIDGRGQ